MYQGLGWNPVWGKGAAVALQVKHPCRGGLLGSWEDISTLSKRQHPCDVGELWVLLGPLSALPVQPHPDASVWGSVTISTVPTPQGEGHAPSMGGYAPVNLHFPGKI